MEDSIDHNNKETPTKRKTPTKRRENLVPEYYLLGDQEVEVFNLSDAAIYLGMSRENLQKMVKARSGTANPIPTFQKVEGGRDTLFLKSTLDNMRRIVPKG